MFIQGGARGGRKKEEERGIKAKGSRTSPPFEVLPFNEYEPCNRCNAVSMFKN
jgi:hypothetical protein